MTDTYRLNLSLDPLAILLREGWGPDSVEVDPESGEVRFIYNDLETVSGQGDEPEGDR